VVSRRARAPLTRTILRTRAPECRGPGVGGGGGGGGNKKRYDQRSRLCCLVTPAMRGTFDVAADMRRRAPRLLPTAEARRVTYRSAVTRCSAELG